VVPLKDYLPGLKGSDISDDLFLCKLNAIFKRDVDTGLCALKEVSREFLKDKELLPIWQKLFDQVVEITNQFVEVYKICFPVVKKEEVFLIKGFVSPSKEYFSNVLLEGADILKKLLNQSFICLFNATFRGRSYMLALATALCLKADTASVPITGELSPTGKVLPVKGIIRKKKVNKDFPLISTTLVRHLEESVALVRAIKHYYANYTPYEYLNNLVREKLLNLSLEDLPTLKFERDLPLHAKTVICGEKGTGKTTLALKKMLEAYQKGIYPFYIDFSTEKDLKNLHKVNGFIVVDKADSSFLSQQRHLNNAYGIIVVTNSITLTKRLNYQLVTLKEIKFFKRFGHIPGNSLYTKIKNLIETIDQPEPAFFKLLLDLAEGKNFFYEDLPPQWLQSRLIKTIDYRVTFSHDLFKYFLLIQLALRGRLNLKKQDPFFHRLLFFALPTPPQETICQAYSQIRKMNSQERKVFLEKVKNLGYRDIVQYEQAKEYSYAG